MTTFAISSGMVNGGGSSYRSRRRVTTAATIANGGGSSYRPRRKVKTAATTPIGTTSEYWFSESEDLKIRCLTNW